MDDNNAARTEPDYWCVSGQGIELISCTMLCLFALDVRLACIPLPRELGNKSEVRVLEQEVRFFLQEPIRKIR